MTGVMKCCLSSMFRRTIELLCLLLFAAGLSQGTPALAQVQSEAAAERAVAAKLALPVHLQLGATNVRNLMETLSEQTGLDIMAAEYLRERTVTLQMEGVTARAALDAIARLYNWKWFNMGKGHIRLVHENRPAPENMTQFSAAFSAALPRDIQTFLFVGLPAGQVTQELDMESLGVGEGLDPVFTVGKAAGMRMILLLRQQTTDLVASLHIDPAHPPKIPYKQLTEAQQRAVLLCPLFEALRATRASYLFNTLPAFRLDFLQAAVELDGNNLLIGSHSQRGDHNHYEGFGKPITLKPIPPGQ